MKRREDNANFQCWDAENGDEEYAGFVREYLSEDPPAACDFEDAAERFVERNFGDLDYPESLDVFVRYIPTGELRCIEVTAEPEPTFSASQHRKSEAKCLAYALTAPARWAGPRPWNWKQLLWEREHPEEAAKQREATRQRLEKARAFKGPWEPGKTPEAWDQVEWPGWMSDHLKDQMRNWRRNPSEWEQLFDHHSVQHYRFGERVTLATRGLEYVTGAYVPWVNDQAFVVTEDGTYHVHAMGRDSNQMAYHTTVWKMRIGKMSDDLRAQLFQRAKECQDPTLLRAALVALGETEFKSYPWHDAGGSDE